MYRAGEEHEQAEQPATYQRHGQWQIDTPVGQPARECSRCVLFARAAHESSATRGGPSSVFAVIGIGLFAVWSILSNITSGVIMFFSFPYKIGDEIKIHDKDFPVIAIIEDIKAFQIHLRTSEGELITYPNNLILQKAVSLVKKDAFIDSPDEGKDAL